MKKFSEFGIRPSEQGFTGDQIKISRILNKEITVIAYKMADSKFDGKQRLDMQISMGGIKYLVWTGSVALQEMIQKVEPENFPFETTIIEEGERYVFT